MFSKYYLVLIREANATRHVLTQPSPYFRKIETDLTVMTTAMARMARPISTMSYERPRIPCKPRVRSGYSTDVRFFRQIPLSVGRGSPCSS